MDDFTYEIPLEIDGTPSTLTVLRSDGAWIPVDEGNRDYQEYLRWLDNQPKKKGS
jgi:hypothetical protein